MKKTGIAIIGCGMIAESHALAIAEDSRAQLIAAAYGTNRERGEAFARKFDIPLLVGDYRELLGHKDIQMVCICTPSGIHAQSTVDFLNSGVHALVEKPLDIESKAITRMIDAAKQGGLHLGCVFPNRTRQGLIRAKKLLESGELGKMHIVECQYRGFRDVEYFRSSKWKGKKELDGGGCLMNQGIHAIDAMLWLAGSVDKVCAQTGIFARDIDVENVASALLSFSNGAQGVLLGTTLSYTPEEAPEGDRIRIECEHGSIVYANGKTTYFKNSTPGSFDVTAIPLDDDNTESVSSGASPEAIDMQAHLTIVTNFISAVRENVEPIAPADSARMSVDTILAIYHSAESGQWEAVR